MICPDDPQSMGRRSMSGLVVPPIARWPALQGEGMRTAVLLFNEIGSMSGLWARTTKPLILWFIAMEE
ncbi:hypothetical protein BH09SUM1_BH09SUM1_22260 [soil metagenome]